MKLVNPVWAKYVAEQMPNWLEWEHIVRSMWKGIPINAVKQKI